MGEACQLLGVVAIVLRFAGSNRLNLAGVGHHHLMPELLEQPTDPGRMGATLHSYAHPLFAFELSPQSVFLGSDTPFLHDFAFLVQQAVVTKPIAYVQTYGGGGFFYY